MICPYCNYKHGYVMSEDLDSVDHQGEHGDFYSLSNHVKMTRSADSYRNTNDEATVYGCPSCNKIFMVD